MQVIDSYLFLFESNRATKIKEIQFNIQICKQIHSTLMAGFKRGEIGKLWLNKVITRTGRAPWCKFKGMNIYQSHHGENTMEALVRQNLCTTSINSATKIRELFQCLQPLECMIKISNKKYLQITENCVYDLTLKYINILYQSSTGVFGGKQFIQDSLR